MTRLTKLASLMAGAAMALSASIATAADYTLTISSWTPPTHGINAKMWPAFIKMVEEATDGRVTAEVKLDLVPPPAQIDLIEDGGADVSIIFHGYQPGRFVSAKLIELPGYPGTAERGSVTHWRAWNQYFAGLDEHKGVKLIGLTTHGPATLHTVDPVASLDAISGLKLRVPGGVGSDVAAALGATGIQVPAPKVYETLASRAADGVVITTESRTGFRLTEVAKHMYIMPGGLYRGSFAIIMNPDTFDSLPADIQQALEEKVFGEPVSAAFGRVWDEIDEIGLEATRAEADNTITVANEADHAKYNELTKAIIEKVIAEVAATGVDAKAAHDFMMQEMSAQ